MKTAPYRNRTNKPSDNPWFQSATVECRLHRARRRYHDIHFSKRFVRGGHRPHGIPGHLRHLSREPLLTLGAPAEYLRRCYVVRFLQRHERAQRKPATSKDSHGLRISLREIFGSHGKLSAHSQRVDPFSCRDRQHLGALHVVYHVQRMSTQPLLGHVLGRVGRRARMHGVGPQTHDAIVHQPSRQDHQPAVRGKHVAVPGGEPRGASGTLEQQLLAHLHDIGPRKSLLDVLVGKE